MKTTSEETKSKGKLFKRDGSPYWWMRFSHNGKRYQESTGKERPDSAKTVMEKRILEIETGYHGILANLIRTIEKQPEAERGEIRKELATKLLSGTVYELTEKPQTRLLIADAFPLYRNFPHKRSPAKKTMDGYESNWNLFTDWLGENHPEAVYMDEINSNMAQRYMTYANGRGITERTFNGYLKSIRSVFEKLSDETGMESNPFGKIESLELQTESRKKLTAKQLGDIIKGADGEMKTLILIGCYTGLRLKDAALLEWSSINFNEREISLIPYKVRKGGNKKRITLPIHSVLLGVLADLKRTSIGNSEYVLPAIAAEYLRYNPNISFAVQKLFKDAGLEVNTKREDGKGRAVCQYSFHSLRHSFVSLCHASSMPQSAVMEMVGHSSESVHMVYVENDKSIKRDGIEGFPNLIEAGIKS